MPEDTDTRRAATESDWVRARGGAPAEVKRRRKAEIDETVSWDWYLILIRHMTRGTG